MHRKGFTIVEIMIVIAVIGILAAITVVSYNGASLRARNAARLADVTSAIEVVEVALTKYKPSEVRASLNYSGGWYRACIGTNLADLNSDNVGDCGYYGASVYVTESAAFNTLLQASSALPDFSRYPKTTSTDDDVVASPYLDSAWVDGKDMLAIEYSLEGEGKSCDKSPLIYKSGGTSTMTPSATPEYSTSGYGVTECAVAVVTDYY
jgi:prepilin-type N-terminal cleavage/methylation domain-containing protein